MYWNKMCYNFMFPEQASILSTSQNKFLARRHSTQQWKWKENEEEGGEEAGKSFIEQFFFTPKNEPF